MKRFRSMAYPYVFWIAIFIVIPMLLIIAYAFTVEGTAFFQGQFTLDNFARFFRDAVFMQVLLRSMRHCDFDHACLSAARLSVRLCHRPRRCQEHHADSRHHAANLDQHARAHLWLGGYFAGQRHFEQPARSAHIGPFPFMYTDFAVVLGMVYNFLPFMILEIHTSLSKMDPSFLEAASDLGANRAQAFRRVTLPLSIPGIISGITLVFLPAVSSFFIPKLLGGGQYVLIGNVIESQFLTSGNWSFGSALSLIMVIIIMISMYLTRKIDRNGGDEI